MNKLFDVLSHHKYYSKAKFGSLITFYLVNSNVCWMWQKQSYMWIFYIISIDQTMYSVGNHGAEDCIHVCCGPFYFYSGKYWIKVLWALVFIYTIKKLFSIYIYMCILLKWFTLPHRQTAILSNFPRSGTCDTLKCDLSWIILDTGAI